MLIKILVLAALAGICTAHCKGHHECEYKGQKVPVGKLVLLNKDCMKCWCYGSGRGMKCCSGSFYTTYPDTCKIIMDQNECQSLVLKSNENMACTAEEGEIKKSTGR